MRVASLFTVFALLSCSFLHAEKVSFENVRFTLEFPKGWKNADGPDDGNLLYREAPGGAGSFSVYKLKIAEGHRADLKGTLEKRVKAIAESGMTVTGNVEGQQQNFDGKPAVFAMIPVEATLAGEKIKFGYYLVLIDAKDVVVIMQASLPSPMPAKLREATLGIIQSFREKD